MNKKILKTSLGMLGVLLGIAMIFGTWRNLVFMVLGSGIFGASILAIITAVVGTTIGVLILYNSIQYLTKKKETTNEH